MDDASEALLRGQRELKEKRRYMLPPVFPDEKQVVRSYRNIEINQLVPFKNHPFRPYDETKLNDMVESIKANGLISPIIVRPLGNSGKYEILSGHNRVNAAKVAGLNQIPALILENLIDDDARLIVAESNLIQRSFADMLHSERAAAIAILYDTMKKKPGYRTDLLEAIEGQTRSPIANRSRTMAKLGKKYGLSKDSIARYLRIHQLTAGWKNRLDHEAVSIRAAVELSYLSVAEQEMVDKLLPKDKKLSIKQAKMLRDVSSAGDLTEENARQILAIIPPKTKTVAIRQDMLTRYFSEDQSTEEIGEVIEKALEMYFHRSNHSKIHR